MILEGSGSWMFSTSSKLQTQKKLTQISVKNETETKNPATSRQILEFLTFTFITQFSSILGKFLIWLNTSLQQLMDLMSAAVARNQTGNQHHSGCK